MQRSAATDGMADLRQSIAIQNLGTFEPLQYTLPNKFVILRDYSLCNPWSTRDCYDLKVYLAPPELLRTTWKGQAFTRSNVIARGAGSG